MRPVPAHGAAPGSRPLLRTATLAAVLLALMLGLLPGSAPAPADAQERSFTALRNRANNECVIETSGGILRARDGKYDCFSGRPFAAKFNFVQFKVLGQSATRLQLPGTEPELCVRSTWKQSRRVRVVACKKRDPRQLIRTWKSSRGGTKIQFVRGRRVLSLDEATGKLVQRPFKGSNDADQRFDLVVRPVKGSGPR